MNYRHFLLSGSLAITSFATVAVIAPATQAQTVTSLPLVFETVGGGFMPEAGAPNPVGGIGASIIGGGFGATIPFNPTTGGAILTNFIAANVAGSFFYEGADAGDSLFFDLLSDGSSVFNFIFATGDSIAGNSFNIDLSNVVPGVANTDLVLQFTQVSVDGVSTSSTLEGIRLLITTTPEPGTVTGLGLLGAGFAASSLRKKSRRKDVTKV